MRAAAAPSIEIAYATRHRVPEVPFLKIKEKVLGKKYELSIAFISPKKIQELNRRYRRKNTSTDILSFALSKSSGELYLSMPDVLKKAKLFGMSAEDYLGCLFIHGLLHLEGMDHGRTMSKLERKFGRAFGLPSLH